MPGLATAWFGGDKPPLPRTNHGFLGGWFEPGGAAAGEVAADGAVPDGVVFGGLGGRTLRLGTRFCTIASGDKGFGGGAGGGAGGFRSRSFACASPEKSLSRYLVRIVSQAFRAASG